MLLETPPPYVDPDRVSSWVALCGRLAPFSSVFMYLSPIPTIRQVVRTGTVGDLPLAPYTSMVTSCFVWIVYGISQRQPLIYLTNCVEFTLSLYYFVEFTNYAPKSSPSFPGSVMRHIQCVLGIWAGSIFVVIFFDNAQAWLGDTTVVLTVMTFASPLAAVRAVLETQSSESIPWPYTLASLFNCCLWMVVGIWELHDVYVYFPAIAGFFLCLLQVALKLHFGDRTNADHPHYMRAPSNNNHDTSTAVLSSNPILNQVRQMINYGNTTVAPDMHSDVYSGLSDGDHDLQLDLVAGTGEYNNMGHQDNSSNNHNNTAWG